MFKTCPVCKDSYVSEKISKMYCSYSCRVSASMARRSGKTIEEWLNPTPVVKNCGYCSKEFTANIRNPHQIYCSLPCQHKVMGKRAVESGRKKLHYIKNKEKYAELKSKTDLKYKDEIRFSGNKEKVLERDFHKCVQCGITRGLIVHHIDHSGQSDNPNNAMDNLVTMCRPCHMKLHHTGESSSSYKHITKEQILEAKEELSTWAAVCNKFGINNTTLIRKRKIFNIF